MIRRLLLLLFFVPLASCASTPKPKPKPERTPGQKLASVVGAASALPFWQNRVRKVRFSWVHVPSKRKRTYAWDLTAGTVTVDDGKQTVEVPTAGWARPEDAPSKAALAAHKKWVNDSFWAMAGLRIGTDAGVTFKALGERQVPGYRALGKRDALEVRYGKQGGYTPGDVYVLYLGDDGLPVAWAFHRGGVTKPTLVTSWERYLNRGTLTLPTRFVLPNGKVAIEIQGLKVETGPQKPASRPTSRPSTR